jgi:hypothetical protein
MLPTWAVAPAAFKLVVESLLHPNTDKTIVVDETDRSVEIVADHRAASKSVHTTANLS